MDKRRLSGKQVLLLTAAIGLVWGLVVAGIGILCLAKTGNQPGDAQAVAKVVVVETLLALVATLFYCLKYYWRRE